MAIFLTLNGRPASSSAEPATPLLYVLRNELDQTGPRFGCGLAHRARNPGAAATDLHPVQQAFIDEQAAQCGYCINGWIMSAAALLAERPQATDRELRDGLSGLKCRCGTQVSVLRAVKRAARAMLDAKVRA